MLGALLTGIAAGPWMRSALHYGAIVPAVLLFLLAFRRAGERTGDLANVRIRGLTEKSAETEL